MRRPCETIDTAMLAPAIGVDGSVEGNIRRIVASDDGAGRVHRHLGLEGGEFLETLPAVVEGDAGERLVAPGCIRLGSPAAPAVSRNRGPSRRIVFGTRRPAGSVGGVRKPHGCGVARHDANVARPLEHIKNKQGGGPCRMLRRALWQGGSRIPVGADMLFCRRGHWAVLWGLCRC